MDWRIFHGMGGSRLLAIYEERSFVSLGRSKCNRKLNERTRISLKSLYLSFYERLCDYKRWNGLNHCICGCRSEKVPICGMQMYLCPSISLLWGKKGRRKCVFWF